MACEEVVISLRALAPRSSASGSNPEEEVLGLSLRGFGAEGSGLEAGEEDCGAGEGRGRLAGGEEEKGGKLKGPSAWAE